MHLFLKYVFLSAIAVKIPILKTQDHKNFFTHLYFNYMLSWINPIQVTTRITQFKKNNNHSSWEQHKQQFNTQHHDKQRKNLISFKWPQGPLTMQEERGGKRQSKLPQDKKTHNNTDTNWSKHTTPYNVTVE